MRLVFLRRSGRGRPLVTLVGESWHYSTLVVPCASSEDSIHNSVFHAGGIAVFAKHLSQRHLLLGQLHPHDVAIASCKSPKQVKCQPLLSSKQYAACKNEDSAETPFYTHLDASKLAQQTLIMQTAVSSCPRVRSVLGDGQ